RISCTPGESTKSGDDPACDDEGCLGIHPCTTGQRHIGVAACWWCWRRACGGTISVAPDESLCTGDPASGAAGDGDACSGPGPCTTSQRPIDVGSGNISRAPHESIESGDAVTLRGRDREIERLVPRIELALLDPVGGIVGGAVGRVEGRRVRIVA